MRLKGNSRHVNASQRECARQPGARHRSNRRFEVNRSSSFPLADCIRLI
jgi:hypothetical protein